MRTTFLFAGFIALFNYSSRGQDCNTYYFLQKDKTIEMTIYNKKGNPDGKQVQEAAVGDAVEILGFQKVPGVGSIITDKSREATEASVEIEPKEDVPYNPNAPEGGLAVILCADTQGSLEAIVHAMPEEVIVVQQKTGEATESDVLLAKSTKAIILAFNTKVRPEVTKLASAEKVLLRNYTIIYQLIDEVNDVVEGKRLALIEEIYGTATILASFPYEKTVALGIRVQDGRIARGDKVRIVRGEDIIGESTITSVRVGKNPTSKVEKGSEAGIVLASPLDFSVGDMIISHA